MAVVVTNAGEEHAVDKLIDKTGSNTTRAEFVDWGTGAGTAAKADTTDFTTATEARVTGSVSKTGTGATAKMQIVATITADGTKTITNAGVWLGAGSGSPPTGSTLIIHGDHGGVALVIGDSIQYTITVDPS